jgi:hypothetical protein
LATPMNRRQLLVRSLPLLGAVPVGAVAALAAAAEEGLETEFGTITASSGSNVSILRDGGSEVAVTTSSAFRDGDRVVLSVDGSGAIVGVEPYCRVVEGRVGNDGDGRLKVAGVSMAIDDGTLVRPHGHEARVRLQPLDRSRLAAGTRVSVLARENVREAARVSSVFILD